MGLGVRCYCGNDHRRVSKAEHEVTIPGNATLKQLYSMSHAKNGYGSDTVFAEIYFEGKKLGVEKMKSNARGIEVKGFEGPLSEAGVYDGAQIDIYAAGGDTSCQTCNEH